MNTPNPFHEGEVLAQTRAGVGDVAKWAGGFIRDHLPQQHRDFFAGLPFFVVSGADAAGRTWVTMIDGPDGFIRSPNIRELELDTQVDPTDPLAKAFETGTEIGVIGIELATRRRNRFSGVMRATDDGYAVKIKQSFGNCPQYIHERSWTRVASSTPPTAHHSTALSDAQKAMIQGADTMFIGSGHQGKPGAASNGFDASHRGGAPGFVHVVDDTHLQIPDYAGNNFFNTIGNLMTDPRVGLVFVDFGSGSLLHISGRATIDWTPQSPRDPDARRVINVTIDSVLDRPGALSLRWAKLDTSARKLRITRRAPESDTITSLYLASADGRALDPFLPGQHLPISVQIPGQTGVTERSYSLSGPARDPAQYRLSIKREDRGLMSQFLHDAPQDGLIIEARHPSGTFTLPGGQGPVVLISAGVGLTPMVSLLHQAQSLTRPVWFLHGARSGRDHALRAEVGALVNAHPNLHQKLFYSQPEDPDMIGRDYDVTGRITPQDIADLGLGANADYMICGPAPFVAMMAHGLAELGVSSDQVHVETFGPSSAPVPK